MCKLVLIYHKKNYSYCLFLLRVKRIRFSFKAALWCFLQSYNRMILQCVSGLSLGQSAAEQRAWPVLHVDFQVSEAAVTPPPLKVTTYHHWKESRNTLNTSINHGSSIYFALYHNMYFSGLYIQHSTPTVLSFGSRLEKTPQRKHKNEREKNERNLQWSSSWCCVCSIKQCNNITLTEQNDNVKIYEKERPRRISSSFQGSAIIWAGQQEQPWFMIQTQPCCNVLDGDSAWIQI